MDNFFSVIQGLDFSKLSRGLDLSPTTLFTALVLVFMIIYGLSLGRTKALISLLSIYVALAFDATFPYLEKLYTLLPVTEEMYYSVRVTLFLLIYLLVFIILSNSFARSRFTLKESSVISVGVISLAQIGLLIAVITNIIPDKIIERMPEYLSAYFATKEALFFWIVIPILLLIFIRKGKRKNATE